jgi:hypothetical protein
VEKPGILPLGSERTGDKPVQRGRIADRRADTNHKSRPITLLALTLAAAKTRQSAAECLPFRNESSLGFNDWW